MKPIILCLLLLLALGCKTPEARRPVSHKSGSFIMKSADRNIKLFNAEQAEIERIIKTQSDAVY
ncbi:MAG: gliding motility-associated peptidyl-prolyl isomerase GldI, partial [Flavobacteriaceae bacterium]|nr:gliding motility-associated peptidyl-prolyl isomerase GldI [Flavobacteriaceae bacterium]